jgi:hypothetical protein
MAGNSTRWEKSECEHEMIFFASYLSVIIATQQAPTTRGTLILILTQSASYFVAIVFCISNNVGL